MHASLWIFVCGLSNKCYESVYSTQTLEQEPWVPVPAMIRVERRFSNYCEMGIISLTDVCTHNLERKLFLIYSASSIMCLLMYMSVG